eukprot:5741773-Alexandrium_andersonii.AAC.1
MASSTKAPGSAAGSTMPTSAGAPAPVETHEPQAAGSIRAEPALRPMHSYFWDRRTVDQLNKF